MRNRIVRAGVALAGLAALACAGLCAFGGRGRTAGAVALEAPPAEVFPWLVEPERLEQWVTGLRVDEVDGPIAVGSRVRGVVVEGDREQPFESELVALEQDRRVGTRLETELFVVDATYTLAPAGPGTELTFASEITYTAAWLRPFGPLITRVSQQALERDLGRLAEVVAR